MLILTDNCIINFNNVKCVSKTEENVISVEYPDATVTRCVFNTDDEASSHFVKFARALTDVREVRFVEWPAEAAIDGYQSNNS